MRERWANPVGVWAYTGHTPEMLARTIFLSAVVCLAAQLPAAAQSTAMPAFRIFLTDGTALASYGEWARVDDRVVFSMPLTPGASPSDLHLVSLPLQSIDLSRTERYADAIRAASYAATRGEADFARLSAEVAQALNELALIADPAQRLVAAERARRSLTDWVGSSYGYRAAEVQEIVGVLDGIIAGLRPASGAGRFDLALTATAVPPNEVLLEPPDHTAVVQHLMTASTLVTSPAEKVSLLQSVIALIDRAVGMLPEAFAATIRATALGGIAEEQRIDGLYARLRMTALADAARLSQRIDIRGLERLRTNVGEQDKKLGGRRPDDVAAVVATVDAHLDAARRLRLARDQWLLRVDDVRTYQRAAQPHVQTLAQAIDSLEDIQLLAGPAPQRLRELSRLLSRGARQLALVDAPAGVASIHAVLRSAYELAENAVQLRLDAAAAADIELARQASAAASGALMLFARARADLDEATRPPTASAVARQP